MGYHLQIHIILTCFFFHVIRTCYLISAVQQVAVLVEKLVMDHPQKMDGQISK